VCYIESAKKLGVKVTLPIEPVQKLWGLVLTATGAT